MPTKTSVFNPLGYKLLHEGALALSEMERNGVCIDHGYLDRAEKEVDKKIAELTAKLHKDTIYKIWRKKYKQDTNLQSDKQLGAMLYEELGYPPTYTEKGNYSTNEKALEEIPIPFIEDYVAVKKLHKTKSTYLKNIRMESTNGFLHPTFNLHLVKSYRSSCSGPNLQNMPLRNPIMGGYIRQCFIPRGKDYVGYEVDYSGIEVKIAACYHQDPVMLKYLTGAGDMHKDAAIDCYCLKKLNVPDSYWEKKGPGGGKDVRYVAKNCFVFPEFYGSFWGQCAPNLWSAIDRFHLQTHKGESLKKYLAKIGIKELGQYDGKSSPRPGTFYHHIRKAEDSLWKDRFKVYTEWKQDWWENYLEKGYFEGFTGFRYEGVMKRNEVLNYAIQGSAFHCLLVSVIRMTKALKKNKMKTKLIGQIHDSILADVHKKEEKTFQRMVQDIMVGELVDKWTWIIAPIEIELDRYETNWFEKKPVEL